MRVPMKVDYGVRALVELAMRYGDGPVQTAAIAYRQGIPEPYLERLMSTLNKSGFVHSRRGPQGGHSLARVPQDVNLYDIMQELDGNASPLDCLTLPTDCMFADSCAQNSRRGDLADGRVIRSSRCCRQLPWLIWPIGRAPSPPQGISSRTFQNRWPRSRYEPPPDLLDNFPGPTIHSFHDATCPNCAGCLRLSLHIGGGPTNICFAPASTEFTARRFGAQVFS